MADTEILIAVGDAPGGVLIEVHSENAIAVKYTMRQFAAAARRDKLLHKVVKQGETIRGGYFSRIRIWNVTAEQATSAISRALPVGKWQSVFPREY